VTALAARQSQVDQSGRGELPRASVRMPDAAAARYEAVRLLAVPDVECPSAGADCRRTALLQAVEQTALVRAEQARHVRLRAALPTVASDSRRWVGSVAALPNAATPPDAAEVAELTVIRLVGRALEPGPAQAQPGRRNSARWNCPPMNGRATAVLSGPQRRAKQKA
jgi:hypothetical protein